MKKFTFKIVKLLYFMIAGFMLFSNYAKAYIDPSAVNYVVQAVAAVVIAAGALLTVFRHKIVALFKGKEEEKKEIHFKEDVSEEE